MTPSNIAGYIANADFEWYEFLSAHSEYLEINFWQPSGGRSFRAISPGDPFFFRLKSPYNAIGGFGYLSRHEILPAWLAWDTFEMANGTPSFREMTRRIAKYRRLPEDPHGENKIGCLMIVDPIFFPRESWIREPESWHQNTVQGQKIDLSSGEGLRISIECNLRAHSGAQLSKDARKGDRFGAPLMVRPRLGQGSFRLAVTDAYQGACAITGEHSLPALEAAHIRSYADGGEHEISNGLLFRSDIHRLFDKGYVTVSPDRRFEVSRKLKEDFSNGRSYYGMHGVSIQLPNRISDQPNAEMLAWHNEHCFKG